MNLHQLAAVCRDQSGWNVSWEWQEKSDERWWPPTPDQQRGVAPGPGPALGPVQTPGTGYRHQPSHQTTDYRLQTIVQRLQWVIVRWPASPDTMAANTVEIPFWIFGQQKWVSGINKNTTCQEVGSMCNTIYCNIQSSQRKSAKILQLRN